MAVFFNGIFMRELRRETERKIRRDTIEKVFAPHHVASLAVGAGAPRRIFSGLGTRRLFSGRSKLGALRSPKSTATGTPKNQYSTSGNQSRSSVGRGRDSGNQRTRGTTGTGRTSGTARSGRTNGTSGTRPTNFQRAGANTGSGRRAGHRASTSRRKLPAQVGYFYE